jgi:hypothetical protein
LIEFRTGDSHGLELHDGGLGVMVPAGDI